MLAGTPSRPSPRWAVLAAAPASASATCHNKYAHPAQVSNATVKHTTLCLLNHQRQMHGRRALKPNRRLARAARRHALDMVRATTSRTRPPAASTSSTGSCARTT